MKNGLCQTINYQPSRHAHFILHFPSPRHVQKHSLQKPASWVNLVTQIEFAFYVGKKIHPQLIIYLIELKIIYFYILKIFLKIIIFFYIFFFPSN
jgi:hypothetical protein